MKHARRLPTTVARTARTTVLKAIALGASTVALIGLTLPIPASSAPRPPANAPAPVHEIHDGTGGGLPSGTISTGDRFGTSVASSVGDIDGDGIPDNVVGASLDDTGAVDSGAAYVIFLNADGTAKGKQKLANGIGGFAAGTNKLGDHFGESVAGLGDIDADGIPDIAVSAPGVDVGLVLDRGAVYVLRLTASGQVKAGGTTLLRQGVANIPASTSALTGEHFGSSVAGIGDINADGVRDIVIGMEGFEVNALSTDEGAAMIVPLQASGAAVAGVTHLVTDGSADLPANSLDLLDGFGNAVAGPGDIDGDGIPDVVVGAHLDDDGSLDHGAAWVLFMRRNGTVRASQKISKTVGGFSSPLGLLETGFATSLGAAGDIDGDGVPDLVVGEPFNDQNGLDNGAVFALYMKADGTVRAYVEFSDGMNGLPRGTVGLGDNFGYGVGGIGDMNADGYPDIAVGAPLDISGGLANGSVFTVGLTAQNIAIDPQCAVGSPAATVLAAQSDGTVAENKVSALDPTGRYLTVTEKEVSAVAPALANTASKVYNFALTSDPFGLLPGSRDVTFPLPTGVGLVPETRIAEPGTALTPDLATLVSGAAVDPATGNLWTYQTVAGVAGMLFRSQDSGATWTGPYSFNAGVNAETQFVNDIAFTADGRVIMVGALYTATDGWRFRTYVMDKMPGTAGAPTGSVLDPLSLRLVEDSVAYTGHLTTPAYVPSGIAVVDDSTMWISLDLGGAASLTGGSYIIEYKRVGSAPSVHYEAKIISPVQTVTSNPPPAATPLTPAPIATAPLLADLGIDDLSSCRGFVLQGRTVAPVCASVWYDRIDFATSATGVDKDIAIGRLNTTNASTLDLDREVRDAYSIDISGLPVRQNGFVYGAGLAVGDAQGSLNASDTPSASVDSLFAVPELLNQVKQWPQGVDVSQETLVAHDVLSLNSAAAINPADHTLWSGTLVGVDYFLSQRQAGGTWQPLVARAIGPASAGWDAGQLVVSDFMFSNDGQILVAGYKLNVAPLPFGSADLTLYSVDTSQVLAGGILPVAVHPIARTTAALRKNGGTSLVDVAFTGLAADPDGRNIYLSAHPQAVSLTRPYFSSSVYKLALASPSPVVPGTLTPVGTGGDIGGIPGWVNDLASCYSTTIATPTAAAILSPTSGTLLSTNVVTLSGTGDVGAALVVTDSLGATVCATIVAPDGTWTCLSVAALPEGTSTLTATASNLLGAGTASLPITLTVDTLIPNVPTIDAPATLSIISDTTPILVGSGEPGATVTVSRGLTTVCSALVSGAGVWSCTPTTALPEGVVTLVPAQADLAGNVSLPGLPTVVTIDSLLPALPVITSPASGLLSSNLTPTLVGTGEAGATVTVKTPLGASVCSAIVDGSGAWTCTLIAPLPQGPSTLIPTQADLAGNLSPPGVPWLVTVDSLLPAIPVITSPLSGLLTTDSTPTLTGTGEAAATVTVKTLAGTTVCSAVVTAGGTWTCTPATALPQGLSTLVPTQADLAGNLSLPGVPWLVTVDSILPAVPVITSPVSGLLTTDSTPALLGTGEPAATITVKNLTGTTICTAVVDGTGAWTCTPSLALPEGLSTLVPTQADVAGNGSLPGLPWLVTVDSIIPAVPVITSPATGQTTINDTPILVGTGEPAATVTVKDLVGTTICSAIVDGTGVWICTPATALAQGLSTLVPTQADLAGNLSLFGIPWLVTIDSIIPAIPAITSPTTGQTTINDTPILIGSGEPAARVTVKTLTGTTVCSGIVDGTGSWTCTPSTALAEGLSALVPTQADVAGNLSFPGLPWLVTVDSILPAVPVITSPATGQTTINDTPILVGTGEPTATVTIKSLTGATICSAVVDGTGAWTCSPSVALPQGLSTLVPTQADLAGNLSLPGVPWLLTVDSILPALPVITSPVSGLLTTNNTPILVGTGEPAATVTVKTLAGATICSAVVDGAGAWTCTPATALPQGLSTLVPTQADLAGNLSLPGLPWLLTVDSIIPAVPVITSPVSGLLTTNSTPILVGSGEPAATVTIKTLVGATVCTAIVNGAGAWTCTPITALPQGLSTLVPAQTDVAGNLSLPGVPWLVTVDTIIPAIPAITSPATGQTTINDTPILVGTGEPAATVTVKTLTGTTICTAIVDGTGVWTCTPTAPLPDGLSTLVPTQADLAGNLSLPGLPWLVTIDSLRPAIPVITSPASGLLTTDSTPALLGTGEASATVTVKTLAGAIVCSAVVDGAGAWTCTPSTPLPEGLSTLIPTQADLVGNFSLPGLPWLVTIDSLLPAIPVITSPVTGLTTINNTPILVGTGEAAATVTVKTSTGTTICSAIVDGTGVWICTPTAALPEGLSTLVPTQADLAGNLSLPGVPWLVTVDSLIPTAPVITSPLSGLLTTDTTPALLGTGEPAATVTVKTLAGPTICSAVVDGAGVWTCTPTTALPQGLTTLVPTQADLVGNLSLPGLPWLVTVDSIIPAIPVITSPATGLTTMINTPVLAGSGEAAATVTVKTLAGTAICSAVVDGAGAWTCTPTAALPEGLTTLVPTQADLVGNLSLPGLPWLVTVDSILPAIPVITSPLSGLLTTNSTPTLTGNGEAGATVTLKTLAGATVCSAVVDGAGAWTCTPTTPLPQGLSTLVPTQADLVGNLSLPGLPWLVTIDSILPALPVITSPVTGLTTTSNTPILVGAAEAAATVTVKTLAGATVCSAVVTAAGTWTCTPTTPLPQGLTTLIPTQTDLAGNLSFPGIPWLVTVDSILPALPVITSPVTGLTRADGLPVFSGLGEPGATVKVATPAGSVVCTAVVDGAGAWTCTPPVALPEGLSTLVPIQTDPAGNFSLPGIPWLVTVHFPTPAPSSVVPVITSPTTGSTIMDSTPTVAGTGAPGETISVMTVLGAVLCVAPVDVSGAWSCDAVTPLAEGVVTIVAKQSNIAGSATGSSNPIVLTTDSAAPALPTINPTDGSTFSGSAEPGSTIVIGGSSTSPLCSVTVPSSGLWTCTPSSAVPLSQVLHVIARDAAGNISAEESVSVNALYELAISIAGTGNRRSGSTSKLLVSIKNLGPKDAPDALVTLTLPPGVEFGPVSSPKSSQGLKAAKGLRAATSSPSCVAADPSTLTCALGVVRLNQVLSMDVTVRTTANLTLNQTIMTARVAGIGQEAETNNNVAEAKATTGTLTLPTTGTNPFFVIWLAGILTSAGIVLLRRARRVR
jgi:large repetitive protein